jgi:hypothetical protein
MTEDLQSEITMNSTMIGWGAKPASTIGLGARLVFMID